MTDIISGGLIHQTI